VCGPGGGLGETGSLTLRRLPPDAPGSPSGFRLRVLQCAYGVGLGVHSDSWVRLRDRGVRRSAERPVRGGIIGADRFRGGRAESSPAGVNRNGVWIFPSDRECLARASPVDSSSRSSAGGGRGSAGRTVRNGQRTIADIIYLHIQISFYIPHFCPHSAFRSGGAGRRARPGSRRHRSGRGHGAGAPSPRTGIKGRRVRAPYLAPMALVAIGCRSCLDTISAKPASRARDGPYVASVRRVGKRVRHHPPPPGPDDNLVIGGPVHGPATP
jgi:hypothetical protein